MTRWSRRKRPSRGSRGSLPSKERITSSWAALMQAIKANHKRVPQLWEGAGGHFSVLSAFDMRMAVKTKPDRAYTLNTPQMNAAMLDISLSRLCKPL